MLSSFSIISRAAILLCCISLLVKCHSFSHSAYSNETDRLSLLAIKSQLHDPLGVMSSWNNSVNLCQWMGVTCGHRHQRVTKLDLANQSISGFLSPYVGNLSFLRFIDLAENGFHGEIPYEVGRLLKLETLILANNSFSGQIPTNLSRCSNLIIFRSYANDLVGKIPAEIASLSKLVELSIADNHLTGQLPASIGNLSTLEELFVRGNSLSGRIPDTLSQLRNLVYINVGRNQFSGMIPPSIYNISSLEMIYLHVNRFNGSLPLDIGVNLMKLQNFNIAHNSFTGSLPYSLSNASNLVRIEVSENQFSGKVLINFNNLKNLSWLILERNNFGKEMADDLDFIKYLTNCSKLEKLGLDDNQFGGALPQSIANLSTTITWLAIGSNYISGTIPPGMGNLVRLIAIGMENNQLTGTIPDVIGQLQSLQVLFLGGNFFRGSIPSSLVNITLLTILSLEMNNLHGNIPLSLGNCQNLIKLVLSNNRLTGALPQQILSITTLAVSLDVSDNLLDGSLPQEVGNLKNLIRLDISKNHFSGEIPTTLGGCTSLEYLNMEGNSFRGSIPLSLSYIKSIRRLDLSSNNLSGQIPQYLENLSFLEYLNLSYNHFGGQVPKKGIFNNKTRLSLVGNGELCGGSEELHFPPCPSTASRISTINLFKVLIPVVVSFLLLLTCFTIVYIRRRSFASKSRKMLLLEQQFPMVSYTELSKATDEFSSKNIIGQGSYGIVYKGALEENGKLVAVKVINLMQKGASKSFAAECEALRNIRHRNLVKIITICSSIDFRGADFKALVYEYMQNGNLEEWLHQNIDQQEMCNLSLFQRLNIAIDVACAIEYLHYHCQPPIIHGDLKPSNVLLDHDMVAHVGDFGLARFLSDGPLGIIPEAQSSSIGIKGTVGYVAPEYGIGSEVSMAGDVYSFGILLLEIFTRRRPTDNVFNNGQTLHGFSKIALPEKVMEIIDPSLVTEIIASNSRNREKERARIEKCLAIVVTIGVACSTELPSERMQMTNVVAKLSVAREIFLETKFDVVLI